MSASEKLKTLEAAMWNDNGPEEGSLGVYLMALPQIVAVVEAAEISRARMNGWLPYDDEDETTWENGEINKRTWREQKDALSAALTALEEALGGDVT